MRKKVALWQRRIRLAQVGQASKPPAVIPHQDAEAEFADADNSLAEGDYRTAITSYRRASILYESAAARANAETLRSKVSETDYGKYSPYHAAEAERLWEEDAELYAAASNESIAEGSAKLIAAERDYAQILTWGAQQSSLEARAQALMAKNAADTLMAENNAADEYLAATSLFADGEQSFKGGDFAGATPHYLDAAIMFTQAHTYAAEAKSAANSALNLATATLENQKAKIEAAGLGEDVNFEKAMDYFESARNEFSNGSFALSRIDAAEVLNHLRLSNAALEAHSDTILAAEKAETDRIAAKKLEMDKRAAELAAELAIKEAEIERLNAEKTDVERRLAETERLLDETERRLAEANRQIAERLLIEIGVVKKAIHLDIDQKTFSPNGDGVKDMLYINIQAPKSQTITEYVVAIHALDASGNRQPNPVKAWRGSTDMRDQYTWDGKTDSGILAPDGNYQAELKILFMDDEVFSLVSPSFALNTKGPHISAAASPLLFSPNGDGNKDTVAITQNSSIGDDWTGRIKNASGAIVRTWSWKSEAKSFSWDGKDSAGAIVRDGVYSYEVSATDLAGNAASAKIPAITVDGTKPKVYVTSSDTGISPNGDGIRDEVSFTIVVEQREGIESWRFSLVDMKGVEKSYFGGSGSEVPARLVWDGPRPPGSGGPGPVCGQAGGQLREGRCGPGFECAIPGRCHTSHSDHQCH